MSDVYILTKGEKNINAGKNENVELPHSQVFCGRLCVSTILRTSKRPPSKSHQSSMSSTSDTGRRYLVLAAVNLPQLM